MLTPQDIKNKELTKTFFSGYDMAEVDDFLEAVAEDYTSLYKENAILKNKLKVLVDKVEEYRSTEDAMRMALLTAQKMSQDMIDKATAQSENIVEIAENEARSRIEALKIDVREEELRLEEAKKNTLEFIRASDGLCKKHMEFLSKIDKIVINVANPPPPPPPPKTAMDDEIAKTARSIEDSLSKIYENGLNPGDIPADLSAPSAPLPEVPVAAQQRPQPVQKQPVQTQREARPDTRPLPGADFHGSDDDDTDEPTTPRPKFNFTNLQFGTNYSQDDKSARKGK